MTSFLIRLGLCASVLGAAMLGNMAAATAGVTSLARPAVEATLEPASFWGQPYPYGYVYHRPPMECWEQRRVDTFFGSHMELVWICGESVTARY